MGRDEGDIVTEQTANEQHWIVLGDIHEGSPEVAEIPELAGASGLLVTGDLTNLGGVTRAKKVLADLRACHTQVFAQIGNMDRTEVDEWLSAEAVNLHRTVHELAPDVAVFGVGGSIFTPFGTPSEFPESKFSIWLEECWQKACRYKVRILISHNPPFGTACDIVASGSHVGSRAVQEFIEEYQPDICFCGHIHESRAFDRIGRTQIVNPGAFVHGYYATLTRDKEGQFFTAMHSLAKK